MNMELKDFFREHPAVALSFSGGTDSAYLLYAALRYADRVKAYYVKSDFQPTFELQDAQRLVEHLSLTGSHPVEMEILPIDILADAQIAANPKNRCYFCKRRIFSAVRDAAIRDGFTTLIDGTNASDDLSDRPGAAALSEFGVLSPLRLCGLTKDAVRSCSQAAGLFSWDKPSYSCLATRIPSGQTIDKDLLSRTERAESYLASLGFSDFRIRCDRQTARIQLRACQLPLLRTHWAEIQETLSADYTSVCPDPEVRSEERN